MVDYEIGFIAGCNAFSLKYTACDKAILIIELVMNEVVSTVTKG